MTLAFILQMRFSYRTWKTVHIDYTRNRTIYRIGLSYTILSSTMIANFQKSKLNLKGIIFIYRKTFAFPLVRTSLKIRAAQLYAYLAQLPWSRKNAFLARILQDPCKNAITCKILQGNLFLARSCKEMFSLKDVARKCFP